MSHHNDVMIIHTYCMTSVSNYLLFFRNVLKLWYERLHTDKTEIAQNTCLGFFLNSCKVQAFCLESVFFTDQTNKGNITTLYSNYKVSKDFIQLFLLN